MFLGGAAPVGEVEADVLSPILIAKFLSVVNFLLNKPCIKIRKTNVRIMMLVKHYLGASAIHGVGLFAAEPIAKGQIVAKFVVGFDQMFTADDMAALPAEAQFYVRRHGFKMPIIQGGELDEALFAHCLPDGWGLERGGLELINHSEEPNVDNGEPVRALRDIAIGEELTQDYRGMGPDAMLE